MNPLNRTTIQMAAVAALIFLAGTPIRGQQQPRENSTLSGFIRGRDDGESLPNTSIAIAIKGREVGTLSNSEGYFAIRGLPSGLCVVAVSYIGYATYRDTFWLATGQDLRRDIELDR